MINQFFKWFFGLFASDPKTEKERIELPALRHVKDVKPGELIQVEWHRIQGRIGYLRCLNNDPRIKKILLEVTWNNYEEVRCPQKEKVVFDYNGYELNNFSILNPTVIRTKEEEGSNDISSLQKQMNRALEEEDYELADKLQKQINKISNKK